MSKIINYDLVTRCKFTEWLQQYVDINKEYITATEYGPVASNDCIINCLLIFRTYGVFSTAEELLSQLSQDNIIINRQLISAAYDIELKI